MNEEEKKLHRRHFFRQGLREMFSPLADLVADRLNEIPKMSSFSEEEEPEDTFYLRPPGAKEEEEFLSVCLRCGCCSKACEYGAITMLRRDDIEEGSSADPYSWYPQAEAGTPCIIPAKEPCRTCEGFPCAKACPSGALVPPGKEAKIGCAHVDYEKCKLADGQQCTVCKDVCPVQAILINKREVEIHEDVCTGCGFCENACPTEPSAIRVYPLELD